MTIHAAEEVKRKYDLRAGDAVTTLRQFSQTSGREILYAAETVRGVRTAPVQGEFTAFDALTHMLVGTNLYALQDAQTGALAVRRRPDPKPPPPKPASSTTVETRSALDPPEQKMKSKNLFTLFSAWLAGAASLQAQATAADAAATPKVAASEIHELSPFVVNTSKDIGYQANSTLSGSRTNTELKDLANPIDVFTKELMDDLGVRDIQDLTLFATGVEPNAAGDNNDNGQEREIWNHNYMQIRGFKTGTATRNFMELLSVFDAYNSERVEFSKGPNSILFGTGNPGGSSNYSTKLPAFHRSFRALQWSTDNEGTQRLTGDFNQVLLREKLAVRLNLLRQEREFYRKPSYHDEKAAHLVTTYKPFKNTTVTVGYEHRETERALPRGVYPTDAITPYLNAGSPAVTSVPATGNNLSINGASGMVTAASQGLRIYGTTWVFQPDGVVRNVTRTVTGANYNINGVGGVSLDVDKIGYPHEWSVSGPNGIADTQWDITEADITQRIGENFHVSLAFARAEILKRQSNTVSNVLQIDPNNFGGNPRFGQYYVETNPFRIDIENEITDVRATASYELDLRKVNRWLGSHQLGAMLERNERKEVWDHGRLVLVATPSGPIDFAATYGATRLQNAAARVSIRDYLDFSRGIYTASDLRNLMYSPGISQGGYVAEMRRITAFASKKDLTEQNAALAVLHSRWWEGRVVTTVGVRKDKREFRTALFEDDPATFERRPVQLLPDIPAGSLDPRNAKLPDTADELNGVSRNYGAVFHATRWLSLTGSYATNFSPGTESLNLFGHRVPTSTGESKDYGFRLNLLGGGRLNVSLIKYETSEVGTIINGNSVNAPNGRLDAIEEILLAHGVTTSNPITGGVFTTSDRVAKGEELVIVGNPTPGWNLRVSATRNENRLTNIAPEVKAFFAERESLYDRNANLRALSGVGETIGEHLALARTSLGLLRTRENVQQFPASEYAARLTAKYSFDRSRLLRVKGFSAGGNYRWASAPVIGYYRNANATFDITREYKGEEEGTLDLFFIYERKLSDRLRWKVQLNIENVFDDTDPLAVSAVNDVDGPNFRWMVTRLRPNDGRAFRLTNTLSF